MNRRTFLKMAGALPLLGIARLLPAALTQRSDLPNIVVLLFDTFSAKHLSLHGYPRSTTPNLNRLAERATIFHSHYSTANFTTPATSSLLTGSYPWSHRAFHINGTMNELYTTQNIFAALGEAGYERITYTHSSLVMLLLEQMHKHLDHYVPPRALALFDELLADRAFSQDLITAYLGEKSILPRDRDVLSTSLFFSLLDGRQRETQIEETRQRYRELFPRGTPRVDFVRYFLLEDAINWIQGEVNKSRSHPYFLYTHLYPPHGPYNTRQEFINLFAEDGYVPVAKPAHLFGEGIPQRLLDQNRQQYDEFIPYVDAEFGRLYDFMEVNGLLENTYLILTSDHGQLFERGIHGHITPTLFEPVVHIPLFVFAPGQSQRRDIFTRTSSVDVVPTLLHLAGLPVPDWCEGQILPPFSPNPAATDRPIYVVEAKRNSKNTPLTQATVSLFQGEHKLTRFWGYEGFAERYELYNLGQDPEEADDLYGNNPLSNELQAMLKAKLAQVDEPFAGQA